MKYHTLFFRKLGKMSQNVPSAAVVIGVIRVKSSNGMRLALVLLNILEAKWVGDRITVSDVVQLDQ